jgi:hypothetical protein
MSVVEIGEGAVAKLAAAGAPVARAEGFPLHAVSMQARSADLPAGPNTREPDVELPSALPLRENE